MAVSLYSKNYSHHCILAHAHIHMHTRIHNTHTHTVAVGKAAMAAKAWVIFISTDYVFDGTKPPYKPGDQKNPLNVYARSKSDAEHELIKVFSFVYVCLSVCVCVCVVCL